MNYDLGGKPLPEPRVSPPEPPVAPRRSGRIIFWLVFLLLVAGAAALWRYHPWQKPAPATAASGSRSGGGRFNPDDAPQSVGVAQVVTGAMPEVVTALGTVTPLATVTVRTQLAGQLQQIAFTEGQMVKKGDFLAQVDPRPYEAALAQAQGTYGKDLALLNSAKVDLARYQTLAKQDSVAHQTLDTQAALVKQDEAQLIADQAAIDTQKLNIAYCHIAAPADGRVGLRQVDAGNYVQPADTNGIVVITLLDPISVVFSVPEDSLLRIMPRLNEGASLAVTAKDRADTTVLATGKVSTVDNQIDTTTGTVKVRAIFDNPKSVLFPNQFVNASLLVNTETGALLVPNAAVQRGAPGTFVYVVKPDNTVTIRKIAIGLNDSKNTVVTSGLQAGDTVVTDGVDRLREGAKVTVPDGTPVAADAGTADAAHPHPHHRRAAETPPASQAPSQ
jgi:multidrug efflux system membrane fusion protein